MKIYTVVCVFVLLYYNFSYATISPGKSGKSSKSKPSYRERKGPVNLSVIERNLVQEEPSIKDIISNYQTFHDDTSRRYFNGTVLGYVTPVSSNSFIL